MKKVDLGERSLCAAVYLFGRHGFTGTGFREPAARAAA